MHAIRAFIHLLSLHSKWVAIGGFLGVFLLLRLLWYAVVKMVYPPFMATKRTHSKSDKTNYKLEAPIRKSTSSAIERLQRPQSPAPLPPAAMAAPPEQNETRAWIEQELESLRQAVEAQVTAEADLMRQEHKLGEASEIKERAEYLRQFIEQSRAKLVQQSRAELNDVANSKWIEAMKKNAEPAPSQALAPVPPPSPKPPADSTQYKLDRVRLKRPGADGKEYDATVVKVFYATDRDRTTTPGNDPKYGPNQSHTGKLDYGECEVSIPDTHLMGGMESPSWLKFEFRPNPDKHIVLWKTTGVAEEAFYDKVSASVARSESKDAFVFLHGYNVSFEDAARRTGQFAYDLKFVGAPIFYSWPSNGGFADYMKDENNIIWSTPHFETFLRSLSQRIGAERIHIIAHSMGNRAVCEALRALSYDPNLQLKLTHLVLAAPDIDAGTFAQLAAILQKHSTRVTLYESNNDKALMASKKLHGNPRAGEPLLVIEGMDTIDASSVDTDFLGHSYWCQEWVVMSDIYSMLDTDQPAARRFGLIPKQNAAGEYFEFQRGS